MPERYNTMRLTVSNSLRIVVVLRGASRANMTAASTLMQLTVSKTLRRVVPLARIPGVSKDLTNTRTATASTDATAEESS